MRQGVWYGVLALTAGTALLGEGRVAVAQVSPAVGWKSFARPMLAAGAMSGVYVHRQARGYLGVEIRNVSDDDLGTLKLKEAHGAEVFNMDHDGPACKAGMQNHDVILQMNGQPIEGEEQLRKILRETPPGRTVTFTISRDGQTQTLTMQMADRRTVGVQAWEQHYTVPAPAPHSNSFIGWIPGVGGSSTTAPKPGETPKGHLDFLGTNMILSSSFTGAKLEVMGPQLAQFFGAENGAGLLVRSVEEHSPAEIAGLRAGDVVVRVNSLPVTSGAEWTKTVHEFRGKPVPVVILREKREQTVTLTPDAKKRSSVKNSLGLEEFFSRRDDQTGDLLAQR